MLALVQVSNFKGASENYSALHTSIVPLMFALFCLYSMQFVMGHYF
jgi:hypothetical protein